MNVENDAGRVVQDLVHDHAQALVTCAYVLTGDRDEAQDIVQTVLLRLLGARGPAPDAPLAYARRAVVNEFLDRQRRHRRLTRSLLLLKNSSPSSTTPPESAIAERDALIRAVRCLKPRERAAIVLRYFADQDDASIAASIGCAPATVRSIIHRALPRMRAMLTTDEGSSSRPTSTKEQS